MRALPRVNHTDFQASTRIELPWPVTALWSNQKVHWGTEARAKRKARTEACLIALAYGARKLPRDAGWKISLHFEFAPPNKVRRDLHNLCETQKAAIDGIADCLGIDDGQITVHWPTEFRPVQKHGAVFVEIRSTFVEGK